MGRPEGVSLDPVSLTVREDELISNINLGWLKDNVINRWEQIEKLPRKPAKDRFESTSEYEQRIAVFLHSAILKGQFRALPLASTDTLFGAAYDPDAESVAFEFEEFVELKDDTSHRNYIGENAFGAKRDISIQEGTKYGLLTAGNWSSFVGNLQVAKEKYGNKLVATFDLDRERARTNYDNLLLYIVVLVPKANDLNYYRRDYKSAEINSPYGRDIAYYSSRVFPVALLVLDKSTGEKIAVSRNRFLKSFFARHQSSKERVVLADRFPNDCGELEEQYLYSNRTGNTVRISKKIKKRISKVPMGENGTREELLELLNNPKLNVSDKAYIWFAIAAEQNLNGDILKSIDAYNEVLALAHSDGDKSIETYLKSQSLHELKRFCEEGDPYMFTVKEDYIPIIKAQPKYPRSALSRGYTGWVLLEFTVNTQGRVEEPVIVDNCASRGSSASCNNSSNPMFDKSALKAAMSFWYRPRIENGKVVATTGVQNKMTWDLIRD